MRYFLAALALALVPGMAAMARISDYRGLTAIHSRLPTGGFTNVQIFPAKGWSMPDVTSAEKPWLLFGPGVTFGVERLKPPTYP